MFYILFCAYRYMYPYRFLAISNSSLLSTLSYNICPVIYYIICGRNNFKVSEVKIVRNSFEQNTILEYTFIFLRRIYTIENRFQNCFCNRKTTFKLICRVVFSSSVWNNSKRFFPGYFVWCEKIEDSNFNTLCRGVLFWIKILLLIVCPAQIITWMII